MEPQGAGRRLAAIMFTDLVGSTALTARSEAAGLRAKERHRALAAEHVTRYGGELLESPGDETLSLFGSAVDAVNCSLALLDATASEPDVSLHVGIHLGDVLLQGGEIHGDGVNVAARLLAFSEGGGICVSEQVADSIKNQENLDAQSLGERQLRNVARPVGVFSVSGTAAAPSATPHARGRPRRAAGSWFTAAGVLALLTVGALAWWLNPSPTAGPPLTSIAVLPFDDLSPGGDQGWLATGMAEELTESLSRWRQLRVIARTSSEIAKASGADLPTIAERLRVGAIVEGSIRRSGEQIRVTAQLIQMADESHLWSARYDRALDDVFATQQEIAREITEAIRKQLGIEEKSVSLSGLGHLRYIPSDIQAYEHMRKGSELSFSTYTSEVLRKAEAHYLAALELEPDWAVVYTLLAWNHWYLWSYGHDPSDDRVASARAAANRALDLGAVGGSSELLAAMSVGAGDYRSAEQLLQGAIETAPENSGVRAMYSFVLAETGRIDDALTHARKATDLDPLFGDRHDSLGAVHLFAGDYNAAIQSYQRALELGAKPYVAGMLALAYHLNGMDEEALEAGLQGPGNPELQRMWSNGFAEDGWRGANRAYMQEFVAQTGRTCSPIPEVGAHLYARAGDAEGAFQCIAETLDTRGNFGLALGASPIWDPYRDDPRFEEALVRVGLAD